MFMDLIFSDEFSNIFVEYSQQVRQEIIVSIEKVLNSTFEKFSQFENSGKCSQIVVNSLPFLINQ
jgi:hypothetical protein